VTGEHHHHQHHGHGHGHGHGHDDPEMIVRLEREAGVLAPLVDEALDRVERVRAARGGPTVRRVLDVGSGPGVGSVQIASRFPDAHVVALDASPAMLSRVAERAGASGIGDRISTVEAELPDGLGRVDATPFDLIWASMSIHHVGDEVHAIGELGRRLAPGGVLAIIEFGPPTIVLAEPTDDDDRRFRERLDAAWSAWFDAMRAGLPGHVTSRDLADMVVAAGRRVEVDELLERRVEAPLAGPEADLAVGHLTGARHRLDAHLDRSDLDRLDRLITEPPALRLHVRRRCIVAT
jgi:SAM-dependent methyltransferase